MDRAESTSIVTAPCSKRAVELTQPDSVLRVAVGVVVDASDRILIAQRPSGKMFAGSWEFPGGKIEPGEDRTAALARELREEIGISIGLPRPLIRVSHQYPFGVVLLDTWVVRDYQGRVQPHDGQQLRWCSREELTKELLLPADEPIIDVLQLPERWTDTEDCYRDLVGCYCTTPEETLKAAAGGANFIVLRESLDDPSLSDLCAAVSVPVYARGLTLEAAWRLGATGVNELRSL